jgi:hypothetical protein
MKVKRTQYYSRLTYKHNLERERSSGALVETTADIGTLGHGAGGGRARGAPSSELGRGPVHLILVLENDEGRGSESNVHVAVRRSLQQVACGN